MPSKKPKKTKKLPRSTKSRTSKKPETVAFSSLKHAFRIVGVGASAGGLEAFTQLIRRLPVDSGMAFVLVQHLDPTHESMLTEILAKASHIPTIEAGDGMRLQPNHIYVMPPDVTIAIKKNTFTLEPRKHGDGQHMPIDHFLFSLAAEKKERAVGIILSGTGTDGTLGIGAVKRAGGETFAQDEKTAIHAGMPQSAIASGAVMHIASPRDIAAVLLKTSVEPELARPIDNIKPNIHVPDLEQMILEVIHTSAPYEQEVQDKDGHWHSLRIRPYKNYDSGSSSSSSSSMGAILTLIDIDSMKLTKNVIQASEEQFRAVTESANDAIISADQEGNIIQFNKSAERIFGYMAAQIIGKPIVTIIPQQYHEAHQKGLARYLAGGGSDLVGTVRRLEGHGKRKDQSEFPVEISLSSWKTNDKIFFTTIIRDITDLKKLEKERQAAFSDMERRVADQTEKLTLINEDLHKELATRKILEIELRQRAQDLSHAARRKDEFLATLAHELRNPLSPILSSLELVHMSEVKDPNLKAATEIMERQTRHMARLLDDLLDVSRITRGKVTLKKEVSDIRDIVEKAAETARPLIDAQKHTLSIDAPPQELHLETDPLRLEQIIVNLLNNAAKYTEPGGHIWLSCRRNKEEEEEVIITVRDDGTGISPDMLPKIFDQFTQARSAPHGGLGIGLHLVKTLVELHGGTVTAQSAGIGKGSEFTVRLPARRAVDKNKVETIKSPETERREDQSTKGGTEEKKRTAGKKILIVDDNTDAASSLGRLLTHLGHTVQIAHEGVSALNIARSFHPEVILLDLGLPGMDGFEIARHLRKDKDLAPFTLVALTGYGQEEDRRKTKEAGFDHHLVKPVSVEGLEDVVGGGREWGSD